MNRPMKALNEIIVQFLPFKPLSACSSLLYSLPRPRASHQESLIDVQVWKPLLSLKVQALWYALFIITLGFLNQEPWCKFNLQSITVTESITISFKTTISGSRPEKKKELCWPLLKPNCTVTSLKEYESSQWAGTARPQKANVTVRFTLRATLQLLCITPPVSSGNPVELTTVLTARHDLRWGNSREAIFQYDLVC